MKPTMLVLFIITLFSCTDLFTTSALSGLKKDASDMSDSELIDLVTNNSLSNLSAEELSLAEVALSDSRIALTDDPDVIKQYLDETSLLLEINMEQADIPGLLSDVLSIDEESGEDFLSTLLDDTERLDNIAEASQYAVDAFIVDPDSLTTTELVVGGVGLISDILQDETKSDALEAIVLGDDEAVNRAALTGSFTTQEVDDILTAHSMMLAAEENGGDTFTDLFEGLPI